MLGGKMSCCSVQMAENADPVNKPCFGLFVSSWRLQSREGSCSAQGLLELCKRGKKLWGYPVPQKEMCVRAVCVCIFMWCVWVRERVLEAETKWGMWSWKEKARERPKSIAELDPALGHHSSQGSCELDFFYFNVYIFYYILSNFPQHSTFLSLFRRGKGREAWEASELFFFFWEIPDLLRA